MDSKFVHPLAQKIADHLGIPVKNVRRCRVRHEGGIWRKEWVAVVEDRGALCFGEDAFQVECRIREREVQNSPVPGVE